METNLKLLWVLGFKPAFEELATFRYWLITLCIYSLEEELQLAPVFCRGLTIGLLLIKP